MRRRSLLMLVAAGGLIVLVAVVVVLFQDPDRYRDEVASLLSEAAGYPVTLQQPLSLSWRPSPTLSVTQVGVAIPSADVVLDSVQVRLEVGSLLARRFRAREVRIDGVAIDLGSSEPSEGLVTIPDPADIRVDEFVVNRVIVRRAGETVFKLDRASLSEPESSRGAKVDLVIPVPGGTIAGKLRLAVSAGQVQLDEMALDTPLGQIEGRLSVTPRGSRLRVEGELSADAIAVRGSAGTGSGRRVFPKHPLDLSWLSAVDASVRVRIGRLSVVDVRMSDVTIPVSVDDGRLGSSATATFAGGAVDVNLDIVASKNDWSLVVDLKQANAGDALGMLGVTTAEQGGRVDLQADLHASGADTQHLVSSLTGNVRVDASQMHLISSTAAIAGSDVLASVGRTLSGGDNKRISVECAVARFSVRDGVASSNEGIGIQTRAMNVMGGGQVSLPKERLDLVLRPWPREGLGLSATTVVGSVGVTGPLSDPRVGLTSDAALRGGATAGAALLTGGLSLIAQGLLERARGDNPCQQAAGGMRPAHAATRSSTVSTTIDKASDGASKAAKEVSGAVKGIGKTLEGLFDGSGGGSGAKAGGSEQWPFGRPTSMSNDILLQRDGGLATVVINRAEKGNAMTRAMWNKLGEVMVRLSADNDIRCVVLRGEGEAAFSIGDDVDELETERCDVASAGEYDHVMARGIDSLKGCRHPMVAMIHGECLGIGLGIAALADIRLCGETSRFGVPLGRQGRVISYPVLSALVDIVGRPRALELLLTGSVVNAPGAHALGLVQRVVTDSEVTERAYGMARNIAAGAPLAARWHKKFVNRLCNPVPLSAAELAESVLCFGTADFHEGREALREHRKPHFRGH